MVSNRNSEGVLDPKLPEKPSSRALKRALLVALRCVDPNAQKRPKMGHVIHMLEADDFPFHDVSFIFPSQNCITLTVQSVILQYIFLPSTFQHTSIIIHHKSCLSQNGNFFNNYV